MQIEYKMQKQNAFNYICYTKKRFLPKRDCFKFLFSELI